MLRLAAVHARKLPDQALPRDAAQAARPLTLALTAMAIAVPKRFSRDWWLAILVVTVGISAVTFLLLGGRDLHPTELVLYCLGMSLLGDVVTALSMEAIAPTRVTIGPGDRQLRDDLPTELALVVSEFDGAGVGRVRIRGEIWQARGSSVGFRPMMGSRVRVINRDGLTLIVSADVSSKR